jgi:hypothetical protein
MRRNIELNDDWLAEARKYSRAKNKGAIIEEALSVYGAVKAEEQRRLTHKERLHRLRARTQILKKTGDSRDILRQDRDGG